MADDLQKLFPTRSDTYPEPTDVDRVFKIGNAALSAIPVLGQITSNVLAEFLSPPLGKRLALWCKEFADDFDTLAEKVDGQGLDKLQENEVFVSSVAQATKIAMGTHQVEKRDMLRNALLNIAVGRNPDEDEVFMFLQLVERFTPLHVKVLGFLQSPRMLMKGKVPDLQIQLGFSLRTGIATVVTELKGRDELIKNILFDLYNSSLIPNAGENDVIQHPAVSNTGIKFINFVTKSPLD
jgi:hypothetical protein